MENIDEIKNEIIEGNFGIAFQKAYNSNLLEEFIEIIKENNLQDKFTINLLGIIINTNFSDQGEKKTFFEIASKIGIEYFGESYGQEVQKKFENAYKDGKINVIDIAQIGMVKKGEYPERQGNIIGQIIDLSYEDKLIGIHRTGGNVAGEKICKEGINLTGHLSSGADSRDYLEVESKLEENISFYGDSIGTLIQQIAVGGKYKNISDTKLVDIILVSIPKSEVKKTKSQQDVILENENGHLSLSPKYIKGYITVNSKTKTMEQFTINPRYVDSKETVENKPIIQEIPVIDRPLFSVEEIGRGTEEIQLTLKDKIRSFITNIRNRLHNKER